ncbi:hypothetical protein EVA_09327 [gut metagenome]|uniref:Uncharacterized protein n=1 Tax=gut metagenome TaxID=749906 RepID=J9GKF7_9ZZZZ
MAKCLARATSIRQATTKRNLCPSPHRARRPSGIRTSMI